jgi:hypothetical protein
VTTIDAPARLSPAELRGLYEQMVLIRVFETESERQYKAAKIGGYCHLSSGQEAATVGLKPTRLLTAAGPRIDPPVSSPMPTVAKLAATPDAVPPEEPLAFRRGSYAFRIGPVSLVEPRLVPAGGAFERDRTSRRCPDEALTAGALAPGRPLPGRLVPLVRRGEDRPHRHQKDADTDAHRGTSVHRRT